jgi:tRNA(Ile)-lysidine synthase
LSTTPSEFDHEALWAALEAQPGGARGRHFRVAFSGGLDSTVLLVAMARLAPRLAPGALSAFHVDHGLHSDSGKWASACAERCRQLGVELEVLQVDATRERGESPEAKAREARYSALRARLRPAEVLLTAHHADDQLETVLLQLLRGAGVAGLAAMPAQAVCGDGLHWRPLLAYPRAALLAWARSQALAGWLEDPANENLRLARNHLRQAVLPGLRAHWPAAAAAVSRTARHCAEAAELLDTLAAMDAGEGSEDRTLAVGILRRLPPARARNLMRWHIRRSGMPVPDERRLKTLLEQILEAAPDACPQLRWPGVVAARYADRLWLIPAAQLKEVPVPQDWPEPGQPLVLAAGLGQLSLQATNAGGLQARAPMAGLWRVGYRRGGERIRLPGRAGSRALKKLFHQAGVPPWLRARIPLLEIAGKLAAVGDLWIDEAWWAPPGTEGWRLCWQGCELPGHPGFHCGRAGHLIT